jgi:class 3 adenylate cyclase
MALVRASRGLRCASELQTAMAESNAPLPPNRRIEFRVGINVGDIVVEDGAIFGKRLHDPVRPSWPTGGPPTSRPDR